MASPNYYIAQGYSAGQLVKECQLAVENGWMPTGGVCMVIDHQRGQHIYSQAFYFDGLVKDQQELEES